MSKKQIVALFTSYNRSEYSDYCLRCLLSNLRDKLPDIEITEYILPDLFRELPIEQELEQSNELFDRIGDSIFNSDLLVIASPVYNLTYSPYLQVLFHRQRHRFLSFNQKGRVVARHLPGRRAVMVLTGRSSRLKWVLMTRHLIASQFSLLFRFWGARVIAYRYIPNCFPGGFEQGKEIIPKEMSKFSSWLASRI